MDFDLPPPNPSPAPSPGAASPIADLSYRNYDGPLHTRAVRWWIVALANIRMVRRKPGFWILALLAFLPYVIILIMLYQMGPRIGMRAPDDPLSGDTQSIQYGPIFFQVFGAQQFFIFLAALLVGTGSIAADNRANALLVYLSKPITKGDYLLGKWMGIFLILFALCVVPGAILYTYCFLSYAGDGFFTNEPSLIWRMLVAAVVPGAVHASLLVGFSAWSKSPRMTGALYAGIYFVGYIITGILADVEARAHPITAHLIRHLSIGGVIEGMGQNIYNITLHTNLFHKKHHAFFELALKPPSFWGMLALTAGLIVGGVILARIKIRAVEVVRG